MFVIVSKSDSAYWHSVTKRPAPANTPIVFPASSRYKAYSSENNFIGDFTKLMGLSQNEMYFPYYY